MNKQDTKRLQQHLNKQGLGPLDEDGVYGPATAAAYQRYLKMYTPMGEAPLPPPAKPWWTSRAIIGALSTIALTIGGLFVDLSGINADELTNTLVALSTGVAGIITLYGSIKREAPIDKTLVIPGVRAGTKRNTNELCDEPVQARVDTAKNFRNSEYPSGPFFDT